VLAWIEAASGPPTRFELRRLLRSGDRLRLELVVHPGGQEVHQVAQLDAQGRIELLLDYDDPDVADADVQAPVAAPPGGLVEDLVPFVDVLDVPRSVEFYGLLGFAVTAEHRVDGRQVWVFLSRGSARLMLVETPEPVDPSRQGTVFYLYSDDLAALRVHLRANGVLPSAIVDGSPGPRQELRLDDPDGYTLMIAQRDPAGGTPDG